MWLPLHATTRPQDQFIRLDRSVLESDEHQILVSPRHVILCTLSSILIFYHGPT